MHRLMLTPAASLLAFFLVASPASAAWLWPLRGDVITPYSNGSDPYAAGQHRGIDIAGEVGAPVVAATNGTVRFAGTAGSSGLTVSIRTVDGFDTSYLHLSSTAVREGDAVVAGQRVGAVGVSGTRSAEQAHLHFGVRDAGTRHAYRDPLAFLPGAPPVSDGPREAPAPISTPVPLAPAPAGAPATLAASDRARAPDPRRVPSRHRAPADRRASAPEPGPAGHRGRAGRHASAAAPAGAAAPVPAGAPASNPTAQRAVAPSRRSATETRPARERTASDLRGLRAVASGSPTPARSPGVEPHGSPLTVPPVRPSAAAGGGGPDVALLLACLGLVGAAALLGLSEDGRAATRNTRDRAAGVLRPLLGRR